VARLLQPVGAALARRLTSRGVARRLVLGVMVAASIGAAVIVATSPPGWRGASLLLVTVALVRAAAAGYGRSTSPEPRVLLVADVAVSLAFVAGVAPHGPGPWAWPLVAVAALAALVVPVVAAATVRRYASLRRTAAPAERPRPGSLEAALDPLDRIALRLDDRLFETARRRAGGGDADLEHRLAWSDRFSTVAVANGGVATQALALAVLVVVGAPFAFVGVAVGHAVAVAFLQALRIERFVRYRRAA
jgi:hypothetical protein